MNQCKYRDKCYEEYQAFVVLFYAVLSLFNLRHIYICHIQCEILGECWHKIICKNNENMIFNESDEQEIFEVMRCL